MKKILISLLILLGFAGPLHAAKNSAAVSGNVVIQENGKDAADFKRALTLASNMHEVLNKANFEIVVYGPNVKLLTSFSDQLPLIQKVQSEGIKIIACGRSLDTENIKASDMAPGIKVVPYGAVRIVNRQKQGWQYIKP